MTATPESAASEESARKPGIAGRILPDRLRAADAPLIDELTEQFERTRSLLTGSPEDAAEAALLRFTGEKELEARIAVELASATPIAYPARFGAAHRSVMRALEVLDREGSRHPAVPNFGPLKPVAEAGVEFIAQYIVKSYAESIANSLRKLYARREVQAEPGAPERRLLAGARAELDRVAPGFSGGGIGAPVLVVGGLAIPAIASLSQYLGAIDITSRWVIGISLVIAFVLFFSLSAVMLRGAAVARRRSRLIMGQPLAALWETIGHAGNPPEDDSVLIATGAVVLAALVWVVLPLGGVLAYVLL
jgi:hypothetical protein